MYYFIDIFYILASRNWIEIIDSCRITGQNFSIASSFSMYWTNFKIWKERIWRNRKTSHGRILFTRTFERNWIWDDSYAKTIICYQISWLDIIQTTPDPWIMLLLKYLDFWIFSLIYMKKYTKTTLCIKISIKLNKSNNEWYSRIYCTHCTHICT